MVGTSAGAYKGHKTRAANKEKFRNRSRGQRKRRERERKERIGGGDGGNWQKPKYIKYNLFVITDGLGSSRDILQVSCRDIQKTVMHDSDSLYDIYDFIISELENETSLISGGASEQWDYNYRNPVGHRRTLEFEVFRAGEILYSFQYMRGKMHMGNLPNAFDINGLMDIIKSVGVWE